MYNSGLDGIFLFAVSNAYIDSLVSSKCNRTDIVIMHPKSMNIKLLSASLCKCEGILLTNTSNHANQIRLRNVNHCGENLIDGCALRLGNATHVNISSMQAVDTYPHL